MRCPHALPRRPPSSASSPLRSVPSRQPPRLQNSRGGEEQTSANKGLTLALAKEAVCLLTYSLSRHIRHDKAFLTGNLNIFHFS